MSTAVPLCSLIVLLTWLWAYACFLTVARLYMTSYAYYLTKSMLDQAWLRFELRLVDASSDLLMLPIKPQIELC